MATVIEDYTFDSFDDGSIAAAATEQVQRFGAFAERASTGLRARLPPGSSASRMPSTVVSRDAAGLLRFDAAAGVHEERIAVEHLLRQITPQQHVDGEPTSPLDGATVAKMMLVLSKVVQELEFAENEGEVAFLKPIGRYGADVVLDRASSTISEDIVALERLNAVLPTLQRLSAWILHCQALVRNVVLQLSAFSGGSSRIVNMMGAAHQNGELNGDVGKTKKAKRAEQDWSVPPALAAMTENISLDHIYTKLVDLLSCTIRLDYAITENATLKSDWLLFKQSVRRAIQNHVVYDFDPQRLRPFDRHLQRLEGAVLDGRLFATLAEQPFDTPEVDVSRNRRFEDAFGAAVLSQMELASRRIAVGTRERRQRHRVVGVCGLVALHKTVFGVTARFDKKVVKEFAEFCCRTPIVPITGCVAFRAFEFIARCAPSLTDSILAFSPVKKLPSGSIERKTLQKSVQSGQLTATSESVVNLYVQAKQADVLKNQTQRDKRLATWLDQMSKSNVMKYPVQSGLPLANQMEAKRCLLTTGVELAAATSCWVQVCLARLSSGATGAKRSQLQELSRLACQVAHMRSVFDANAIIIAASLPYLLQHTQRVIFHSLSSIHEKLAAKKGVKRKTVLLSVLDCIRRCLFGPTSRQRISLVRLGLPWVKAIPNVAPNTIHELTHQLDTLEVLLDLPTVIAESCDTSWLRPHAVELLAPVFFSAVASPNAIVAVGLLPVFFQALCDRDEMYAGSQPFERYRDAIVKLFRATTVKLVCTEIETDLRKQAHLHLAQEQAQNDGRGAARQRHYSRLLRCPTFRFYDVVICVRAEVERRLDGMFYEMAAVAPQDRRTYSRMRQLAGARYAPLYATWPTNYGRDALMSSCAALPAQALEQSSDILKMMRNIQQFSEAYCYDLATQTFVEKYSSSKYLSVVRIDHVAKSIRTHGTGVINTTVNYVYQFVRAAVPRLSQFLLDENIKSLLLKDYKFVQQAVANTKTVSSFYYSYDKAEHVVHQIGMIGQRQLQHSGAGGSAVHFLDRCRELLTQMGNALGYVRLVRSGSMQGSSRAMTFIPKRRVKFWKLLSTQSPGDGLMAPRSENSLNSGDSDSEEEADLVGGVEPVDPSDLLGRAAKAVDTTMDNFTLAYSEQTDFLRIFVNALGPALRTSKEQSHMRKYFYVLVPALCLNYLDHVARANENLARFGRPGQLAPSTITPSIINANPAAVAAMFDDGFALAIAFLLRALNANREFDSLHWFRALASKYQADIEAAEKKGAAARAKGDTRLAQSLELTVSRVRARITYATRLKFAIRAASVLFVPTSPGDDDDADSFDGDPGVRETGETPSATSRAESVVTMP